MAATDDDKRESEGFGNGESRFFGPSLYIFTAAAIIAGASCYSLKGAEVFYRVLAEEGALLLVIFPRVIAALLLAGLIQVMVPQDMVSKWVGRNSGVRGIVIAAAAGVLTPGGPLTAFPVVVALSASGAHRGALVAYMTGWALLGLQRTLVWELPFLGTDFVMLRFAASAVLPILAGLIAMRVPIILTPPRTGG